MQHHATQHHAGERGFTLAELLISFSILTIVSLMGYIVLSTSTEASRIADTQAQLQANLRNVMQLVSSEVRTAYSQRHIAPQNPGEVKNTAIPNGTISITVSADGRTLTFQKPVPSNTSAIPAPSPVITLALQCEDAGFANGNGKLDTGEDANGNKILDRSINRTQSGTTVKLGSVNDIADVQFALRASQDTGDKNLSTLFIRLVASKVVGAKQRLVKADLEGRIHLEN